MDAFSRARVMTRFAESANCRKPAGSHEKEGENNHRSETRTFNVLRDSDTLRLDGDSVAMSRIFAFPDKLMGIPIRTQNQ
jgi:hypothetical protein